jgi:hypothetical protein
MIGILHPASFLPSVAFDNEAVAHRMNPIAGFGDGGVVRD